MKKGLAVAFAVFCLVFQPISLCFNVKSVNRSNDVFLKYEVVTVFVGELKHVVQITNPWQTSIKRGCFLFRLLKTRLGGIMRFSVMFQPLEARLAGPHS